MKGLEILIVDDDRDFAEALGEALELARHRVTLRFSGADGIQAFAAGNFDLAFFDVVLPGMSGVETLAAVRAEKPSARVIMMTGYSVPELLEQARQQGAIDVLYKPLDVEGLLVRLRELFPEGVLVVDDDPDFLEAIQAMLSSQGYQVSVARTAEEAIRCASSHPTDLLLLDVHLADANGLDVLRELERRGCAPPTLFVTGFDGVDLPHDLSGNQVAIVSKSCSPKALLRSLQGLERKS